MAAAFGGRVLIAMLVVLGLLHNAAATTYYVGSQTSNGGGWTLNTSSSTDYGASYDSQFANTHFVVGDVLTFDFANGIHNVLVVPASDVSTCDKTSSLQEYDSAVNVTLNTTGSHGYICGISDHCTTYGMQLTVTVNAAAAPGSPSPAPAGGSQSPSPSRSGGSGSPARAPGTPTTGSPGSTGSQTAQTAPAPTPSAASLLKTGPAMAMGALLAACAVVAL